MISHGSNLGPNSPETKISVYIFLSEANISTLSGHIYKKKTNFLNTLNN